MIPVVAVGLLRRFWPYLVGGLAVVALLWWVYAKGKTEGRLQERAEWAEQANVASAEALKAKLEDFAAKETERQAEAAEVAQMREGLTAEREKFEAQRAEQMRVSQRAMAEFTRRLKAIAPDVAAVPDERISPAIEAALAEHRRLDGAQ